MFILAQTQNSLIIIRCCIIIQIIQFAVVAAAATCSPPLIQNGSVSGSLSGDSWTGSVTCSPGYSLVGSQQLKCREGQWSDRLPVCAVLEGCTAATLPGIEHGRKYSYQASRYRGLVYKYSCDKGYRRMGQGLVHCHRGNWVPHTAPVCTKPGCDPRLVNSVYDGTAVQKAGGAIFTFHCSDNTELLGASIVYCDGETWSDSPPTCQSPTQVPTLYLDAPDLNSTILYPGMVVAVICQAQGGNPVPQVSLYRNNEPLGEARPGQNTHTWSVKKEDNSAYLRCDAINQAMQGPAMAEIGLRVEYPPTAVTITPTHQIVGQDAIVECSTDDSNPPARIEWEVRGRGEEGQDGEVLSSSTTWTGMGWVTTSRFSLYSTEYLASTWVICTASNSVTIQPVHDTQYIVIHYPPAGVSVMGPPSAAPGSLLTVQCQSYPSVPEASLHWAVVQDRERVEYTTENMVDHMEDGSYTTRSVLEFQAGQGGDVAVECYAKHEVLGENTKAHAHVIIIKEQLSPTLSPEASEPEYHDLVENIKTHSVDEKILVENELETPMDDLMVANDDSEIVLLDQNDTLKHRFDHEGPNETNKDVLDANDKNTKHVENLKVMEKYVTSHSYLLSISLKLQIVSTVFTKYTG